MTGYPNHVADDQDEFWDFGQTEGAMTMTVNPEIHYAEQAALAALVRWVELHDGRWPELGEQSDRLFFAGQALKAAYDAQEQM